MKKFFIGLLVVAAGTAVYFFVIRKKNNAPAIAGINQALLTGKWKAVTDSAATAIQLEFRQDGMALSAGSEKTDTLYYNWKGPRELLLKKNTTDTSGIQFTVTQLSADSLVVQDAENASSLFTKVK